jgi:hypothetical protein
MARTVAQGFDEFLSRMTPTPTQFSAASRHRAAVEARLDAVFGVYRSFETGSLRHGTGVRGYGDADDMFSLKNSRPSSDTALRRVREELQARFLTSRIYVSRPAVVCEFADGLETIEVVPAYFASSNSYDIPAPGGDWLQSALQEHLEYVNECDRKHPGKGQGSGPGDEGVEVPQRCPDLLVLSGDARGSARQEPERRHLRMGICAGFWRASPRTSWQG